MIRGIITGHGNFSTGMLHALEMIAGEQEKLVAIPFFESDSMEEYKGKIQTELAEESTELIIFTDLMGGTPFNVSMLLGSSVENVSVISGTNLPMLLEFIVQRWSEGEMDQVLERLLHTANKGVVVGKLNFQEKEIEEDGI